MSSLEPLFWKAWSAVAPILDANPDELRARLARRRSAMFASPPRAWCLAIRASDTRINPATAAMVPEDAMDLDCEWHPFRRIEHTVDVDKRLAQLLCAPVTILPPGEPWHEVCRRLGIGKTCLTHIRRAGWLQVHHIKGLGGRRGHIPLVYSPDPLDPAVKLRQAPDPIWGGLWTLRANMLPDDFSQTLTRTPVYHVQAGRERFMGWRWLCPGCRRTCRAICYPLPVPDWGQYARFRPAIPLDQPDHLPAPLGCFACYKCHRVQRQLFPRVSDNYKPA